MKAYSVDLLRNKIIDALPYALTPSQRNAAAAIATGSESLVTDGVTGRLIRPDHDGPPEHMGVLGRELDAALHVVYVCPVRPSRPRARVGGNEETPKSRAP